MKVIQGELDDSLSYNQLTLKWIGSQEIVGFPVIAEGRSKVERGFSLSIL